MISGKADNELTTDGRPLPRSTPLNYPECFETSKSEAVFLDCNLTTEPGEHTYNQQFGKVNDERWKVSLYARFKRLPGVSGGVNGRLFSKGPLGLGGTLHKERYQSQSRKDAVRATQ
jgi:hypothetical protein